MFISYTTHSDVDLAARERLCDILGPLCRARTLGGDPWKVWVDDRCLNAGDDWNDRLIDALHDASLFVVVMSRKYLNSRFCMDIELPLMLERHLAEGVPVLGVWLDDVNRALFVAKLAGGRVMSLQERQCLPRGPKGDGLLAVRKWEDEDDAWSKVAVEIERAWPPAPEKGTPQAIRTPARTPASPKARFTPFLCDRREPADAVMNSLESWNCRPLLIASEGRRDDCLSEWAERIVQHEFAEARPEFDRGEVQFADPVVLEWPTGALEPQRAWQRDLTRRYTGFNNSAVDALHAAQGKAPAFWVTELTTDTAAALAVLDGLIALLAAWPDRRPNALVVVAVHLVRPDGDKPSRLARQFKDRLALVEAAGRVHAVWAGSLPVVRETDVLPWLGRDAVKPHLPACDPARLKQRLGFDSPKATMTMRAFADQVHHWLDDASTHV